MIQDWRSQLEQVRRETRDMKALERKLKFSMDREQEKAKMEEKKADANEIHQWRQQQEAVMREHVAETKMMQKVVDLEDSKDFQEFKRSLRPLERDEEARTAKEAYMESKENSEWRVDLTKQVLAERESELLESRLENCRVFAEHNLMEQKRECMDQIEARLAAESREMDFALFEAKRERDLALQGLEHARRNQILAIPENKHLAGNPK